MLIRIHFILVIICFSLNAQQEEKVVAKVGSYKLYESEFQERFDFSVHPKLLNENDKLASKHEFLEQLIAEKLLSLEAQEMGYNHSEIFSDIITPLENMFVRDALYNYEIKNKTAYSNDEIIDGIKKINKLLKMKFIYSRNREEIEHLYSLLIRGVSFDSLLLLRSESKDQLVPREITFGTVAEEIEDSVYNLKQGEFTGPMESKDGYYILKLVGVGQNQNLKDKERALDDVKRIVEKRAEYKRYLSYYHSFFSNYKITSDREIFENLIKIFVSKIKAKYQFDHTEINNNSLVPNSSKFYLRGSEISSALELLGSELRDKTFIDVVKKEIKVKYFLNQLCQDGLYIKDTNEINLRASLSSYIRKFIEDELLTAEGNKKGLKNSPDVEKYLNMWKDSYLSKMLMMSLFDSIKVTEEEACSVYIQNEWNDIPLELVNVVEILTDSLIIVETVLNELSKGGNIKVLAREYTIRDSLKDKGGEFGFFPITKHGEIGKIASQMKIGDVYGPLKLDEGYSVFQLIDRIPLTQSSIDSIASFTEKNREEFNELKDQIIMQLSLSKFEKFVNEFNASLAQKYGVEIYEDVLDGIDNVFMNLVVVRYMGFGGEIFAVPYTEQFSGWYDIWLKNKNMIQ